MISLMLDDASMEILRDEVQRLTVAAERGAAKFLEAWHHPAHVGDAEASFEFVDRLSFQHRHYRIDEVRQRHRGHIWVARMLLNFEHRDLERQMHLRAG